MLTLIVFLKEIKHIKEKKQVCSGSTGTGDVCSRVHIGMHSIVIVIIIAGQKIIKALKR
jgi:hypothetical protein